MPTGPSRSRRTARALVTGAAVLVLAGCSLLPQSGAVRRTTGAADSGRQDAATFAAPGPGRGDAPIQIVNGFLTALTANPTATGTARQFLTRSARGGWNPSRSTVIYSAATVSAAGSDTVVARLGSPRRLDSRGAWTGADAGSRVFRLQVVKQRGEWRIANPPDALLIPDYFFTDEYRPYELYFFDPGQRILVPERVYLPRGQQTASRLVQALLDGPPAPDADVLRTAFPARTELDLSVPVSADGVAEVPLSKQMLRLSPAQLERAAAQLAWTLRQVPGLTRIRLSAGDGPLALPDGRRDFSVQQGDAFAPYVRSASTDLYAVGGGRLLSATATGSSARLRPVSGPFGRPGFGLRSVAVSLDGKRATGVAAGGRTVFSAPVSGGTSTTRVYRGRDVLRPAYDREGAVWLIDRTPEGARVLHVSRGRATPVTVPGVSGQRVVSFVLSRDGGRLVAVVDRGRRDLIVVAGLVRGPGADRVSGVAGRTLSTAGGTSGGAAGGGARDVRGLTWRSTDDVAVLGSDGGSVSIIGVVSLDGSPGDPDAVVPDTWPGSARTIAGSPAPGEPLYLVTGAGKLRRLDPEGRWRPVPGARGLTALTYVG